MQIHPSHHTAPRITLTAAPYILHSKDFLIEDDVAVIGSSNMDMRSFGLNYEISLMMLGPEIVQGMRQVEDMYRELSRELSLEEWLSRRPRCVDNVMRLTAALQWPPTYCRRLLLGGQGCASVGRLHFGQSCFSPEGDSYLLHKNC